MTDKELAPRTVEGDTVTVTGPDGTIHEYQAEAGAVQAETPEEDALLKSAGFLTAEETAAAEEAAEVKEIEAPAQPAEPVDEADTEAGGKG
jgi:hypothetical protein